MDTLQVNLSRLNEGSKNGFLNRGSLVTTNLGIGFRQFMFNRKEPEFEPVFESRPFFRQFPQRVLGSRTVRSGARFELATFGL
jgi:hypothetical protein